MIEKTRFSGSSGLIPYSKLRFYSREDVWDIWDLSADRFLMIATDRVWLNGILAGTIPGKGNCLAELMLFWADFFKRAIGTFILSGDLSYACNHSVWLEARNNELEGRTLVVRKIPMMPLRWVVGHELQGGNRVMSVGASNGQELSCKDAALALEKWIKKNRIKNHETGELLEAESLKRKMDSLVCCLFRKANVYATARRIYLCCADLSFSWFEGKPVLAGDFFTFNSCCLSLLEDQGESPGGLVKKWLVENKWEEGKTIPKIPDYVWRKAAAKYEKILKRLKN